MRTDARGFARWLGAIALVLTAQVGHADEIDRCLSAHPEAQRLRQDGKLQEARTQLLVCARTVCPAVVRAECGRWLGEVDALIPSIVVSARSTDGPDLVDVSVSVDGRLVAEHLDGRYMSLDPGAHKVHVEAAGFAPVDQDVLLREGEKTRPLAFTLKPTQSKRSPEPVPAPPPPAAPPARRPVPLAVYLLGGLGALGLGSFAYFGLSGRTEYFDLENSCGPACTSSQVSPMRTKLLVADVSLGVSVVALAAAAYFFFTRPEVRESPRAAAAF